MAFFRVQSRLGVQTPAIQVWDIVSRLESWKDWNPFYTKVEGKLSIGTPLILTRVFPGGQPETVETRVVDWVPDAQLVWSRPAAPFATSLGFVELEPLSEEGCILAVGEVIQGIGSNFISKADRRRLKEGCAAMAEALKARAELAWAGADEAYKKQARAASLVLMNTGQPEVKIKPADPVMTFGRQPPKRK